MTRLFKSRANAAGAGLLAMAAALTGLGVVVSVQDRPQPALPALQSGVGSPVPHSTGGR